MQRDVSNPHKSYNVIVDKDKQIGGHLPWKLFHYCSDFLGRGVCSTATMTGRRRQGLVDIRRTKKSCSLTFSGPEEWVTKMRSSSDTLELLEGSQLQPQNRMLLTQVGHMTVT